MFRRNARIVLGAVLLLAMLMTQALAPAFGEAAAEKPSDAKAAKAPEEDPEVKLGRENAEANDKEVKLINDPALLERVNRIGQALADVANREQVPALWGDPKVKKFTYTFKIVDDKDINAYSLPAGYIYVNKGLLDFVHSDDELAGVLAHEISHAAHHHMMRLIHEQEKIQQRSLLPLLLIAIFSKASSSDIPSLIMAGQLYTLARLNTYGVEAEKDADQTAVHYMVATKYNPVGILTFMERLAQKEKLGPQVELGIYRTHPPSEERAQALLTELEEMHIPIDRRAADPGLRADVSMVTQDGSQLAEVRMYKVAVLRLADANGEKAQARAQKVADRLNTLFDRNLNAYEVRSSNDHTRVVARGSVLVTFTQADADAQKATLTELTQRAINALDNIIMQDRFNRIATSSVTSGE